MCIHSPQTMGARKKSNKERNAARNARKKAQKAKVEEITTTTLSNVEDVEIDYTYEEPVVAEGELFILRFNQYLPYFIYICIYYHITQYYTIQIIIITNCKCFAFKLPFECLQIFTVCLSLLVEMICVFLLAYCAGAN